MQVEARHLDAWPAVGGTPEAHLRACAMRGVPPAEEKGGV
jgi:hypothetical protein